MAADAQLALDAAHSKPPDGVVRPPKEIRNIIEKTAGYVTRNGPAFEDRMRTRANLNDQKLSFLHATNRYNSFNNWRLSEVKTGRGTAPPEFELSARMPNINALDLDVVKLTVLFVAKNRKNWTTQLSQREAGNYQSNFLRPQHSLYQLQKKRIAELQRNTKDRFHLSQRAKQRAEWVKHVEAQEVQKEEVVVEAEKLVFAQIDWHAFVVIETVLFTEADDATDLPPPTSLNDLQIASLEQKAMMPLQPHNMRIEEAMQTEGIHNYTPRPIPQQASMPIPSVHFPYPQQVQYTPTPDSLDYAKTPAPYQKMRMRFAFVSAPLDANEHSKLRPPPKIKARCASGMTILRERCKRHAKRAQYCVRIVNTLARPSSKFRSQVQHHEPQHGRRGEQSQACRVPTLRRLRSRHGTIDHGGGSGRRSTRTIAV
ncbi:SF3a splicing factor complex subunit [Elasticomyces elasticus]|nr:SF3a splicing factor complex subunit [Elasticomyces elasticus]